MGIVKSYQKLNQIEQAIAHCQGLTETKNNALGIWVNRTLPKLEAALEQANAKPDTQTTDNNAKQEGQPAKASPDNEMLLHQGIKAYKDMKRDRAISLLEEYSQSCTNYKSRNYMNAQMTLVKAYREVKDYKKAVTVCETLVNSESFALKSWASKALPKLQEELAKISPPETSEDEAAVADAASASNIDTSAQTTSNNGTTNLPASAAASDKQAASSSYIFDATPHGMGNLKRVTPSLNPLSSKSASSSVESSIASPDASSPSDQFSGPSQPGDIPDSMANGLASVPKRSASDRSKNLSSQARQSHTQSSKSKASKGRVGSALLGAMGFKVIGGLITAVFVGGRILLNIAADLPIFTGTSSGMTSLQEAVMDGKVATVEKLLAKGKSIETSDENGNTLIFWALNAEDCNTDWTYCSISADHQAIANLLMAEGANINVANTWQETPLHWAAGLNGSAEIVQTMVNRGANVNAQDMTNTTPLHWAAGAGAIDNVELLLNSGADINVKDTDGYTPLDYAGNEEVAALLRNRNAISGFN